MMKKLTKFLALILLVCTVISCLASCSFAGIIDAIGGLFGGKIDYAAQLTLNMDSETAKEEVTVKLHIDGDTVHFNSRVGEKGVLKARFLAINTPESTGKIEKWGKKASAFTKEKLKDAVSIIVESDNEKWNLDSTGARHLVWVWYKSSEDAEYRNLNLEILQEGLAIASNTSENRYGDICMKALEQAEKKKLYVHSGEDTVDPDLYVGDAIDLTIKELRTNIQNYVGMDVAFEGVVTKSAGGGCYVEAYDEENDMYNGIYIYMGQANGAVLGIMTVGNRVKVIGNVQYWEGGASYQVTNLKYRVMKPDDPKNIQKIGEGEASFKLTSAEDFVGGMINIEVVEDGEEVFKQVRYAQLALGSTISMNDLKVIDSYVSDNKEMTLTCRVNGLIIKVRTEVLFDENNNVIDDTRFKEATINVKGIVDCFNGEYQIRVFGIEDIEFH